MEYSLDYWRAMRWAAVLDVPDMMAVIARRRVYKIYWLYHRWLDHHCCQHLAAVAAIAVAAAAVAADG